MNLAIWVAIIIGVAVALVLVALGARRQTEEK